MRADNQQANGACRPRMRMHAPRCCCARPRPLGSFRTCNRCLLLPLPMLLAPPLLPLLIPSAPPPPPLFPAPGPVDREQVAQVVRQLGVGTPAHSILGILHGTGQRGRCSLWRPCRHPA